ncbi:MAG TPA: hypothetical protein VGL86_03630 [Polyangia bacterium]
MQWHDPVAPRLKRTVLLTSAGLFVVAVGIAMMLIVLCAALHHEATNIAIADGHLEVTSAMGLGSTFRVRLPMPG